MSKLICCLILFQVFNFYAISQEIQAKGIISDSITKSPIPYVNIGVINKNIGTITNLKGAFTLKVSNKYENDSITISHVNYYTLKVPIKNIENKHIFLKPKTIELAEVVISNKKKTTRKIGVKSYNRLLSMRVISKSSDIIEVGQRINIPEKEVQVKKVNFNIRKYSKLDGVSVRINFYKNVDNAPGERLILKNIIKKIPLKTVTGWVPVDLTEDAVYVSEDFFVGIEFIPNFKNPSQVDLGAILTKGKGYRREASLGNWIKLGGGAAINVEVEY